MESELEMKEVVLSATSVMSVISLMQLERLPQLGVLGEFPCKIKLRQEIDG